MWFRLEVPLYGPGWRRPYVVLARGATPGHRYYNKPEVPPLGLKYPYRLEAPSVHMCTKPDGPPPYQVYPPE